MIARGDMTKLCKFTLFYYLDRSHLFRNTTKKNHHLMSNTGVADKNHISVMGTKRFSW